MSLPNIWIAIAAAGQSRRMGSPKQLLPIDGVPMLQHVVRQALAAKSLFCPDTNLSDSPMPQHVLPVSELHAPSGQASEADAAQDGRSWPTGIARLVQLQVAVIASDEPQLREHCEEAVAHWIVNREAALGMSSSIRMAVRHAELDGAAAVMILLGDQPGIDPQVIEEVVATYQAEGAAIVQARYLDEPGHPVLFDKRLFSELLQLQGDRGARELLRRYRQCIRFVDVPTCAPVDLDTPEDYEAYGRT